MRIDSTVKQQLAFARIADRLGTNGSGSGGTTGSGGPSSSTTADGSATPRSLAIADARAAVGRRLDHASRGLSQAAKVRDATSTVASRLAGLRQTLAKAQQPGADRGALQTDFARGGSQLKAAAQTQQSLIEAASASPSEFEPERVGGIRLDQAGLAHQGPGTTGQIRSVADALKLDLATASDDQLHAAADALRRGEDEARARQSSADQAQGALSKRVSMLGDVQAALGGRPTDQHRTAESQVVGQLGTGSLVNLLA